MGPLHGVTIIEIAAIGPVPFCGMLLSDLGAEVIRIDRTQPSNLGTPMATRYQVHLRGRRSVAVNLKTPEGRDIVLKIAARSAAFIEGQRPGVMERLGLAPGDLGAINPALVYGRMTGWGQDGPYAQMAGHDINYISVPGVLHSIGYGDRPPVPPLNLVGDYGGGLFLAMGVLAAIIEAKSSGRGQIIDTAMVDTSASVMSNFYGRLAAGIWSEERGHNVQDGGSHYYGVYETADGLYVSIGANESKFYHRLLELLGLSHDQDMVERQRDRAAWPALRQRIADVFRTKTQAEWRSLLENSDACFAPVLTLRQAVNHPQLAHRGTFIELDGVVQPGPAPRFSRTVPEQPRPPVEPGTDTDAILAEIGYNAGTIEAMRKSGAIL